MVFPKLGNTCFAPNTFIGTTYDVFRLPLLRVAFFADFQLAFFFVLSLAILVVLSKFLLDLLMMRKFCESALNTLNDELHLLEIENEDLSKLCGSTIPLIENSVEELRERVNSYDFTSPEEEIYFFKVLKPQFVSNLLYYNAIYKIEIKKPFGGKKVLRDYYRGELVRLKRYFDDYQTFYRYHRAGSTHLDHKYFLRHQHDFRLLPGMHFFVMDPKTCTSHGFVVAQVLANDRIEVFLEKQLQRIGNIKNRGIESLASKLQWTGSKSALIELIYALNLSGSFNNGNVDIKLIAGIFEKMFNVELGDIYRTYHSIRFRKKNRSPFLENLREVLIRYMDDQDA